jgi:hypothetical protein
MRFPKPDEDLTGKVCVCSIGRIAVVTEKKSLAFGAAWVGVGFDGKGVWASTSPVIAYESVLEYHDTLMERFGGKMSAQG